MRGAQLQKRSPKIKRLSEYLGQSYFEYLAGLDDLVLIMDESHRYRASAGIRSLNELRPLLGLELTATPFVEGAGGKTLSLIHISPAPNGRKGTKSVDVGQAGLFDGGDE